MLMLPPISPAEPGARAERRVGGRRAADRGRQADLSVEPPVPASEGRAERKASAARGRGRGRRASDREPKTSAESAPFGKAPKPHAPLVAQLVATALGVEQTRIRRRATLEEAVALYEHAPEPPKRSRGEA